MNDFLEAGQIVGTHGLKGELRVNSWCDSLEALSSLKRLYFDGGKREIKVKSRPHKNIVLMKIEGVDTIEEAERLRGIMLFLRREDLKLDEDSFFIKDIIGMKVVDSETGEEYGEVIEVSNLGASDLYHMKSAENGQVILIPAIPDIIVGRSFEEKTLSIKPMAGLFDD